LISSEISPIELYTFSFFVVCIKDLVRRVQHQEIKAVIGSKRALPKCPAFHRPPRRVRRLSIHFATQLQVKFFWPKNAKRRQQIGQCASVQRKRAETPWHQKSRPAF
jgi:hypothetical protein